MGCYLVHLSADTTVLNRQEEGKVSDTYHFASVREAPVLIGPQLSSPKPQIATASPASEDVFECYLYAALLQ